MRLCLGALRARDLVQRVVEGVVPERFAGFAHYVVTLYLRDVPLSPSAQRKAQFKSIGRQRYVGYLDRCLAILLPSVVESR